MLRLLKGDLEKVDGRRRTPETEQSRKALNIGDPTNPPASSSTCVEDKSHYLP